MAIYNKPVCDPWFTYIVAGHKTIEGRINRGDYANLKPNDIIIFECNGAKQKTKVIKINNYTTFRQMLEAEDFNKVLPYVENIEKGVNIYYQYYTKELENEYNVIAIHLEKC